MILNLFSKIARSQGILGGGGQEEKGKTFYRFFSNNVFKNIYRNRFFPPILEGRSLHLSNPITNGFDITFKNILFLIFAVEDTLYSQRTLKMSMLDANYFKYIAKYWTQISATSEI